MTKCNVSSSFRRAGASRGGNTHTHTVKWANFHRVHASCCTIRSLLSPRHKTSPIGFFYVSKFLVSQPATLPLLLLLLLVATVVVLDSRLGQGSKRQCGGVDGAGNAEKLHRQFEFFFSPFPFPISISKHKLCCMSRARISHFFGGLLLH